MRIPIRLQSVISSPSLPSVDRRLLRTVHLAGAVHTKLPLHQEGVPTITTYGNMTGQQLKVLRIEASQALPFSMCTDTGKCNLFTSKRD